MPKNLINEKEAAPILGMTLSCLRNWRHLNKGPGYYKVGRRVLYDVKELEEFLEYSKVKTNPLPISNSGKKKLLLKARMLNGRSRIARSAGHNL